MLRRCYTEKSKDYYRYGAVGITVCDRWQGADGFINFLIDMKERPTDLHTIDRIDGNKGYSLGNCRWATRKEQSNNRKTNRKLTIDGETLNISQWSERSGINYSTIRERKNRGWSDYDSVATPVK